MSGVKRTESHASSGPRSENAAAPPTTIVTIQTIGLVLCFSALLLSVTILFLPYWQVANINAEKSIQIGLWAICSATNDHTECAYWSTEFLWRFHLTSEPQYVFYSRSFLLFSILVGTLGTLFAIIGTGMVCCQLQFRTVCIIQAIGALCCSSSGMLAGAAGTVFPILFKAPNENLDQAQITFILSNEYFDINPASRAPFQYGICLYICWGVMVLYGVGSSLYTFTACLLCCEHCEKNRYTSLQSLQERPTKDLTGTMERVVIPEESSQESSKRTEDDDVFEAPLSVVQGSQGYNRVHASSNTSNNAGYRRYNSVSSAGEFNNKIARALSLRDAAFETASSAPSHSYNQQTRQTVTRSASTTDYSTIKEYELANNFEYTDNFETDIDEKSSMASVSIIASTNPQGVMSASESAQSEAKNAIVPFPLIDIHEYERRMSTQQGGFTAEVCKLINGPMENRQAQIGMFRLRLVKYRIRFKSLRFCATRPRVQSCTSSRNKCDRSAASAEK